MNIHEYQAKQILAEFGLPVPRGEVASSAEMVPEILSRIGVNQWVIKAQIHSGGRGLADGVRLMTDKAEAIKYAQSLFGKRLVTYQTTAGLPVNQVLIEETSDIVNTIYVGIAINHERECVQIITFPQGGGTLEDIIAEHPENAISLFLEYGQHVQAYQCRRLAYQLSLPHYLVKQFTDLIQQMIRIFLKYDLYLIEINPLGITSQNQLVCLDAKIVVDDNALFRQPLLGSMHDRFQDNSLENQAHDYNFSYLSFSGNIGCIVNGMGLAMVTIDLIKSYGGNPAHFLDIGGRVTKENMVEAFKMVFSDKNTVAVLINIFGGITRCDLIADSLILAIHDTKIQLPIVVLLNGIQAGLAIKKLRESNLNIIFADGIKDAAMRVTQIAKDL
jgi:succinyl-CoA synthetase beta subunit